MKAFKRFTFLLIVSISVISCSTKKVELSKLTFKEQLKVLFPKAKIDSVKIADHFLNAFELTLQQPLDHNNIEAGTFEHHIYISHSDYKKPTVLITEGYNARHRTYELSKILKATYASCGYLVNKT